MIKIKEKTIRKRIGKNTLIKIVNIKFFKGSFYNFKGFRRYA